jgi:hypothetical protein
MPDPPVIPWDMPLADSCEGRLLQATLDRLKTCDLPGIDTNSNIIIQSLGWVPEESQLKPPYIIVTPAPESTPWQDGTNESDDTTFAVFVTVVIANAKELTRGLGLQLYWRERIRRKFQNLNMLRFTELTLEAGTHFIQGYIESGDKFIEAAKRDQRDAQYFLCRYKVREPREDVT